jgi:hypothetical protein
LGIFFVKIYAKMKNADFRENIVYFSRKFSFQPYSYGFFKNVLTYASGQGGLEQQAG